MIKAENLSYTYPFQKQPALRNVSFQAGRGEAVLVTGPSGGGKSTLLRIINGLIPNHCKGTLTGRLVLNNVICPAPLEKISRHVGTLLQNPDDQFLATSVEDEIALALEWRRRPGAEINARTEKALRIMNLSGLACRSVFSLSQGEKQKCVLAALLALEPEVLVMDEPTANLSPDATENLRNICLDLKRRGMTLIIVDHRLYWLRGVLDRLLVLNNGEKIFSAERNEAGVDTDPLIALERNPRAAEWGLRAVTVRQTDCPPASEISSAAVEAREISFRYPRTAKEIFRNYSAGIPAGSVTALTGDNGAGKTTLARLLCGLEKPEAGGIFHSGKILPPKSLRRRTAFVMQQMDIQLYMRTVMDELLFSAPRGMPAPERLRLAGHWLSVFHLTDLRDRHPHSLSGGEKQRLVIACALMKQPGLLILDEPTSGLDGRNMRMIGQQIRSFARSGGTVLLITHDLELLETAAQYQLNLGGGK